MSRSRRRRHGPGRPARIGDGIGDAEGQRAGFDISGAGIGLRGGKRDIAVLTYAVTVFALSSLSSEPVPLITPPNVPEVVWSKSTRLPLVVLMSLPIGRLAVVTSRVVPVVRMVLPV